MGQMTGERGRKGTAGAMGRVRRQSLRLEDFPLDSPARRETQKIGRFLKIPTGNHDVRRSERVQFGCSHPHLIQILDREASPADS